MRPIRRPDRSLELSRGGVVLTWARLLLWCGRDHPHGPTCERRDWAAVQVENGAAEVEA